MKGRIDAKIEQVRILMVGMGTTVESSTPSIQVIGLEDPHSIYSFFFYLSQQLGHCPTPTTQDRKPDVAGAALLGTKSPRLGTHSPNPPEESGSSVP